MKRGREHEDDTAALEACYSKLGCVWDKGAVGLTRDPAKVVHGLGAVALRAIRSGELLVTVPRKACFGAAEAGKDAGGAEEEEEEEEEEAAAVDSQAEHALQLVRALGEDGKFGALVRSLPDYRTFRDLPWLWEDTSGLTGTELELPVRRKRERLRREFEAADPGDLSFEDFERACGVCMSHMNPWFGTSIVPFVYVLNCPSDGEPNVEFELDASADVVEGRALRDIAAGEELTQAYGDPLVQAELVYRCGFALEPELATLRDVVSVSAEALLSGVQPEAERSRRQALLQAAGVLEESPWDGCEDHLTVEVARGPQLANSLGKLAVGVAVASWAKEGSPVGQEGGAHEGLDAMDMAAVGLCAQLLGEDEPVVAARLLQARQEEEGDGEGEEVLWEALLVGKWGTRLLVEHRERLQALLEAKKAPAPPSDASSSLSSEASTAMSRLWASQSGIIKDAECFLSGLGDPLLEP